MKITLKSLTQAGALTSLALTLSGCHALVKTTAQIRANSLVTSKLDVYAPSEVTASPISTTQIDIRWKKGASTVEGFYVERASGSEPFTRIATLSSAVSQYSDVSTLRPATSYRYRITAFISTQVAPSSESAPVKTPSCQYSLSGSLVTFDMNPATSSVNLTTQTNCQWTAASDSQFVAVSSQSKAGMGSFKIEFTVAANSGNSTRSAVLDVSGQRLQIQQAAAIVSTGKSYYVSKSNGSDSNDGSISLPFKTINRALPNLNAGDTVWIRAGVYEESLLSVPGGTEGKPVTIAAYSKEIVTLRPTSGAFVALFQGASTKYIVLRGLILDGENITHDVVKITSGPGTREAAASHIRIEDSEIMNARSIGILTTSYAGYNEFINLKVHDNGACTQLCHGLYIATHNNVLDRLHVYRNAGYGIHLYSESPGQNTDNCVVRNSIVHDNSTRSVYTGGLISASGANHKIYNNIVYNEGSQGINVNYGATSSAVYNNTIYNIAGEGLLIGADSKGASFKNNIVYRTGRTTYLNEGENTTFDHNLFAVDPDFANASEGDFRLLSDSPAIDAGVQIDDLKTDITGGARVKGGKTDIGAYEY